MHKPNNPNFELSSKRIVTNNLKLVDFFFLEGGGGGRSCAEITTAC